MYIFDQVIGGIVQFEVYLDVQVLVFLDVIFDQLMVDEGMVWEVINCIQKFCKKCSLVLIDEIIVYYKVKLEGRYLNNVIESYIEFIFVIIKVFLKFYLVFLLDKVFI